ncbi:uncharacterized protein EV154DRAFT_496239 [Mucor mucedo]|uniref:uncharacterized protein n=1 Tax=Mucor mucedo TaxID=29922 RepID=UPI002220750E|nr:uncharacterized protein EV154DRAFT_496239 [Mucor mucedo]KAI7895188.1 hypothetical protein EV154DRAFT_496239 [Mucor mucedo]
MLFWTKLLTIAHAVTTSIHPFLPLYFAHMLKFDILTISILISCTLILRVPASAFWIDLVDHKPPLHGVFTGLLTAIGTAGILLILSVPPSWTSMTLPVAILSTILDGLFYQPLIVLIDSAIIKILGDYKILYAKERQYGKLASAIMSIGIGWNLDDDHDFDTLMVTTLIGSVILFLLSLSTNVQAADPSLLDIIQCHEEMDETSPLTKYSGLHQTETTSCYKPYSLFGEQLSHISEEDASMLRRMITTNSTSIRPLPASIHSSPYTPPISRNNNIPIHFINDNLPPSFELARLPYPPPVSPSVVLITFIPGYYQKHQHYRPLPSNLPHEEEYYYLHCYQQQSKWILKSFMSSIFCLGLVHGMTQSLLYIYLHDALELPMHLIGIVGLIIITADLLASKLVIWIIHRFQLYVIIACAHVVLVLCALCYTWLQPRLLSTELFVIILQCLQGLSLHSIWLLAAHQVDSVVLTGHKRMMLKGGMAALYSSLGPAVGVLIMGYLVSQHGIEGYTLVYQYAAGFTVLSAILSWEWSTTD